MDFIFSAVGRATGFLARNEEIVWLAGLCLVAAYLISGMFLSPYGKYVRILKKNVKYLKRCVASKTPVNAAGLVMPKALRGDYANYLSSDGRYPSEVMRFRRMKYPDIGFYAALSFTAAQFALLGERLRFGFMPFVTAALLFAAAAALRFKRTLGHGRASRAAEDFLRRLDLAMGKNTRVGMTAGDVCDDGAVDDVVAKINFLKENGVNENTAKEVAALLSDGRLDKPRTREQQKRLNIALNGLLQVMSARQEKQIGARG